MIFHQDNDLPQRLSTVLMKIGPEAFTAWGADFTRNAGVYLARYYRQNKQCKDLLIKCLEKLNETERTTELMDCIIEAEDFSLMEEFITNENVLKFFYYIRQNLLYGDNQEEYERQMMELFDLFYAKNFKYVCMDIALEFGTQPLMDRVYGLFENASKEDKLQFCIIISQHQELNNGYFENDSILQNVIRNNHTAKMYSSVIQKLQLQKPRAVNDVMKKQDIEIDWAKFNSFSGNFIMNGFVHQGYCDDLLFNSHIPRETDDAKDQKGLDNADVNESQIVTAGAEVPTDKDQQERLPQGHNLFIN